MTLCNRRSESGASLAEAALLVAVVAVVAAGALSFLGSRSDGTLDEAGKGIHEAPSEGDGAASGGGGGGGSGGSGGGGGGGGTGGAGGAGSASTVPSTAAPQPTTTTPAATTTTAAVTTTAPAPRPPAAAELGNGRAVRSGSSRWNASADLQLAVEGSDGASMAGTATVRVQQQRSNGQWTTDTIEVSIDEGGRAVIESGPHVRTGSSRISTVRYTVVAVELHGEGSWDGEQPSISIGRP